MGACRHGKPLGDSCIPCVDFARARQELEAARIALVKVAGESKDDDKAVLRSAASYKAALVRWRELAPKGAEPGWGWS